ncbi:outer membrane lipoprotein-sorting protein [Alteromonas sp. ASW11-19]|uniref:Outer membrane lipoprotein-sorting protein n=1 Tax=Alteromonas salexigens TaxID=2982530 RepID=A0ABT2VR47_9ALTE|nr:outer membrane lipoprotein-sorting protein [Alteromonas salexigens]MCU7555600.1 outer membrane lipoprotein-sorting protein [Alteromonas salexigens]
MTGRSRLLLPLLAVWGMLLAGSAHADAASEEAGLKVAKERKARDQGWDNSVAETLMILRNAQGQESTRDMRVKTLEVDGDGDKALTIFDSPRDVSGTAFLSISHTTDADEQWIYLPALKRVKRIASRNKSGPFMASEFAFEDLTSFEVEKYSYDLLREETYEEMPVYVLEQKPQDEFSGYSRQVLWIDKQHYRVHRVDFYDKKGELLKTLEFEDYKLFKDTYWRPMTSLMYNVQTRKSTDLITKSLEFGVGLEDSDFDKNSLRRAR